ncbi:MBL fold metallo-hydrolase [Sphingobacteriaceae bacterium]|nr:MBL fold metallo-hydrolase [Sphingobacteriaceae bacterium]
MKAFINFIFVIFSSSVLAQLPAADTIQTLQGKLVIQPVFHAAMVLTWNKKTIYVDPYNGKAGFKGLAAPDLILITDIHPDHLDLQTLNDIDTKKATFIVTQAVAEKMPALLKKKVIILANDKSTTQQGITFKAVAMYNYPEQPDAMHIKGRGNGYVFNLGGQNIYISGDTGGTPEMLSLKNIDIAFVCMNMPYTMDVANAARAVLEFKPKIVYPYHYRGRDQMSDTELFKNSVQSANKNIEVRLRNWYSVN